MKGTEYYIEEENNRIGPLDLLTLVRRIRQGKFSKEAFIYKDGMAEALPAYLVPEIKSIFDDQMMIDNQPDVVSDGKFSFMQSVKNGVEFFKFNQSTALIVGAFLLIGALGGFLFSLIPVMLIAVILSGIWCYAVFGLMQVAMLKKSRMQLLSLNDMTGLAKKYGAKLLAVSVITLIIPFIIPAMLSAAIGPFGWFLLLVPGTFVWTYLFFVPLIVVDLNIGVKKAFGTNHRGMRKMGLDNFSVMYLLLMVNIIVAPLLLPLLITLPITLCAMCEMYDAVYN